MRVQNSGTIYFAALILGAACGTCPAAETNGWPTVEAVESQPLIAQTKRLIEALEFIGSPLPETARQELTKLAGNLSDQEVSRGVQQVLDPFCLAAVSIKGDDTLEFSVVAGSAEPQLYEQGWRSFLVKVVNPAEVRGLLNVESPSAQSLPNSPPGDVADRWMDVSMYDGRPLKPSLSGLPLEYRIIQVYSTEVGRREASLKFRLGGSSQEKVAGEPKLVHEWTFEEGAEGWEAARPCDVEAREGVLHVSSTGNDPAISAKVDAAADGPVLLSFWMTSNTSGFAQVFWRTEDEEEWVTSRSEVFQVQAGAKPEFSVRLPVKGRLAEVRIDPSHKAGKFEIDWIRIASIDAATPESAELAVNFETVASTPVTFNVLDEKGEPCLASFVIRDTLGRVYPAPSKRLAPDFFFHSQVYRGLGEIVRLPAGEYTIECNRGPESIPETKQLTVGDDPVDFVYRVQRWIDPVQYGWYSGDHHIHAAGCLHYTNPTEGVHPPDMARHIMGEDLKVGCNLTWGPCFDYQKQFFTGKVDEVSQYPYLLRYDIEVSGFGSHVSGHLCLLRLKDQMYPGGESSDHWPTLGLSTLKWAKAQGAITGPAHSAAGIAPSQKKVEGKEGPPLPGWSHKVALPNYYIPQYNGIGANEYVVDITHDVPGPDGKPVPAVDFISTMDTDRVVEWNMWYHTLNCGFRVRASGETDFPCISGDRVGMGRVYVKVDDQLDYDQWCEGIKDGRSYVSDGTGHLIDFRAEVADDPQQSVELGENGSELPLAAPGNVRLFVKAAVRREGTDELPVELIVNSYPVEQQMIPADGSLHELEFDIPVDQSSWVAVRVSGSAHTNPIFVLVDGQPIRTSASSAEWLLKGVDQCWENKQKTYAEAEQEDAEAAYEHARVVYRKLLEESRTGD